MNSFFAQLTEDHDKVKSILKEIEELDETEGENRRKLLLQLKKALIPHARAEEKMMYSEMQDSNRDVQVLGLEGYQEHHLADILLEELEGEDPSSPLWDAKFMVLKENVTHHIREEESHIFDAFEKAAKNKDFDAMTEEFISLKMILEDDLPTQIDMGTTPENAARGEIQPQMQ